MRLVKLHAFAAAILLFSPFLSVQASEGSDSLQTDRTEDAQSLGKALAYFTSGKYHEALLLLQPLDRKYNLNPRYRAYIGVCYYYEWNYAKACEYLDRTLPLLNAFAPHERSFYCWSDAESHFNLKEYWKAIPLYEEMLNLCYANEKPDAFYRLGFCYLFLSKWPDAADYFESALAYYLKFRNTPDLKPRLSQIRKMIRGCRERSSQIAPVEK